MQETASESATESYPEGSVVPIISTGADELRDLIRADDPSAFGCVAFQGVARGEFYDKALDDLVFPETTYFFEARYTDGSVVEIRVHPDLISGDQMATATNQAERIAKPIGLLPPELRAGIERVGFLGGDETAQADGGGEGIHVYADNVTVREAAGRFEETLFHESVHTSLDDVHAASPEWRAAQAADGEYLTEYAGALPDREDLAETALYAYALLHYPERVSAADAASWNERVPNRIAYIGGLLSPPGSQGSTSVSC